MLNSQTNYAKSKADSSSHMQGKKGPYNNNNASNSSIDSMVHKYNNNPSFWKVTEMSFYLGFHMIKASFCCKKEKMIYYRNIEKEFNARLNFDTIIPSILKHEKVCQTLMNKDQLDYLSSSI